MKGGVFFNQNKFVESLKDILSEKDIKISKRIINKILDVASEHDEEAEIIKDSKGNPRSDSDLRDDERVTLGKDIHKYFEREVKPYVSDAWVDEKKIKIGYEISFTKYFYEYQPLRPLEEIEKDIKTIEKGTDSLMKEIFKWYYL